MKLKHTLMLLTGFLCLSLFAQKESSNRLEFELKDGYENEEIEVLGSKGFIMLSQNSESKDGMRELKIDFYNTDMKFVKSKSVEIEKSLDFYSSTIHKNNLHAIYKNRKGKYAVLTVNTNNMDVNVVEGRLPKKTSVNEFVVLGKYAYLSLRKKNKPFLYSIDVDNGDFNLIPIIVGNYRGKRTFIDALQVMEESNEMMVLVKIYTSKKTNVMYSIHYDKKSEKLYSFNLTEKFNKNIISASATKISDDEYVYTGTYSKSGTTVSEGIFFFKINDGKKEDIQLYRYSDLKEFNKYLSKKTQKKIEKKKKKGKSLKIGYRIAIHNVRVVENGYIFLGEAYYPTYRTETYYETQVVNGVSKTVTRTRQVFDGYQYTHAFLCKFDKKGKMLWDKTFDMWPSYKPFRVRLFISFDVSKDNVITMVFASYNRIVYKAVDLEGVSIKDTKSEVLETTLEGDKTKYSFSDIIFWYDNYFIAHGVQRIKNKEDKSVKRKRSVFFINKIEI